jgi:hypothetical protein
MTFGSRVRGDTAASPELDPCPHAGHEPMVRMLRHERDIQRIRRVTQAAESGRQSAMLTALAQIDAAFDEAAIINAFKIRVERLFRLGPYHPAARARFGTRAAMLCGRNLETAVTLVERWWRDERKAFQIASAFGGGTRLSREILSELRLILRFMRFKKMQAEYENALEATCEIPIAAAAE